MKLKFFSSIILTIGIIIFGYLNYNHYEDTKSQISHVIESKIESSVINFVFLLTSSNKFNLNYTQNAIDRLVNINEYISGATIFSNGKAVVKSGNYIGYHTADIHKLQYLKKK